MRRRIAEIALAVGSIFTLCSIGALGLTDAAAVRAHFAVIDHAVGAGRGAIIDKIIAIGTHARGGKYTVCYYCMIDDRTAGIHIGRKRGRMGRGNGRSNREFGSIVVVDREKYFVIL